MSIDALEKPSVVAAGIIQTLSWETRKAKFVKKIDKETYEAVLQRFLPLIGAEDFLAKL